MFLFLLIFLAIWGGVGVPRGLGLGHNFPSTWHFQSGRGGGKKQPLVVKLPPHMFQNLFCERYLPFSNCCHIWGYFAILKGKNMGKIFHIVSVRLGGLTPPPSPLTHIFPFIKWQNNPKYDNLSRNFHKWLTERGGSTVSVSLTAFYVFFTPSLSCICVFLFGYTNTAWERLKK